MMMDLSKNENMYIYMRGARLKSTTYVNIKLVKASLHPPLEFIVMQRLLVLVMS